MNKTCLISIFLILFLTVSCSDPSMYIDGEVELFGINLIDGKRSEFREILEKKGAPLREWNKDPFEDSYLAEKLLDSAWLLTLFYLKDGEFCKAEYDIDQKDGDKIEEFAAMFKSKYGPCTESATWGLHSADFTWKFKNGIQIHMVNSSQKLIRIEYINTHNLPKLPDQKKEAKIEIGKRKGESQTNAF